jgi:hypothetical protein
MCAKVEPKNSAAPSGLSSSLDKEDTMSAKSIVTLLISELASDADGNTKREAPQASQAMLPFTVSAPQSEHTTFSRSPQLAQNLSVSLHFDRQLGHSISGLLKSRQLSILMLR